jgi:Cys-tRNA(Pro)/Cys-tRNA(Cys) deacylase
VAALGTRATDFLRRAEIPHELVSYEPAEPSGRAREDRPRYGSEAAAATGIPPDRICKTLVAEADARLVVAVVPVSLQLDLKRLAAAVGARRASLAEPSVAQRATGYVVGGISPIATTRRLPVVIDASIAALPSIHVSAGRRGLQVRLDPEGLRQATSGSYASIARPED